MTRRRVILIFSVTLVIVGASYGWAAVHSATKAPRPAAASAGIDDPVADPGEKTTDQLIAFWGGRFERDPHDFLSLNFLGQAFMRKGRETGDASAYVKAEAAFRKSLELDPDYEVTQADLSASLFVKHDFQGALDIASRVYASDPEALQVLATIGDAQLELGHYADAEAAYQKLVGYNLGAAVDVRFARLIWLQGRPQEALGRMQQAADEAQSSGLSGEAAAWYQFELGEFYFNTGHPKEAAQANTAALAAYDHYYLALAGLGKALAAQGRYAEAIDHYQQAAAIIPQPDILAALGDLYTLTGQPEEARRQYATVEFIGRLAGINQVIYNRQLALYYANHDLKVDQALELTTRELAVRRDVYGYDAQAWALYKNRRYAEARQAIDQAMAFGTRDALLWYHAGMINMALGDCDAGQSRLAEALALNAHFDVLQARIAQTTLDRLCGH
jgi:tetratricopeptide (TPR) repeat protein